MEENNIRWKDFAFDLFGTTWKVHFVDYIEEGESVDFGHTSDVTQEIIIALGNKERYKFTKEQIVLTLTHEIMHSIAQTGQYTDINYDEPFIEWSARCIVSLINQDVFNYVEKEK